MSFLTTLMVTFVLLSTLLQSSCEESAPMVQINQLSAGLSNFSREIYQCTQSSGNVIISPFSLAMALGLISQAADGTTFDEIQTGLHLNMDKKSIADQFHEYYRRLEKSAGQSELMVANQIYVQQGYELKTDFHDVALSKFLSGVEVVNFIDAVNTSNTINNYVKEKTKNKIKDIVKPETFNLYSRAILVNAIYLKSEWVHTFKESMYNQFFINETERIQVAHMTIEKEFRYADLDDLDSTAVRMNYVNSTLSFVIVLPKKRTGLQALESQLADYDLSRIIEKMQLKKCKVTMPQFKIESEFNMNEILAKMGMGSLFQSNANLSGLFTSRESIYMESIIHKATIEVNERSTESSAGTRGHKTAKSKSIFTTCFFTAHHPFMFFIWDEETKTSIFSGRVVNLPVVPYPYFFTTL